MSEHEPDAQTLRRSLHALWGLEPQSIERLPVGFPGSYHYKTATLRGSFFLTVYDMRHTSRLPNDPDAAFSVLEGAFRTAHLLRHSYGFEFVLAPTADRNGATCVRISRREALVVFPFVEGSSSKDGAHVSDTHRRRLLAYLGALHAAGPPPACTRRDTLPIPGRPELKRALEDLDTLWNAGPYAASTRALLRENADDVRHKLRT